MYILEVYIKSFGGQKRGSLEPPRTPPAYGPAYTGSCLENAGCILAPVWRMQAACWFVSGGCRLYIGSCLENAGCILALIWKMQAVYWLLCEECRL